VAVTPI